MRWSGPTWEWLVAAATAFGHGIATGVAIGCFGIGLAFMIAKLFGVVVGAIGLEFGGPIAGGDISWSTVVVLLCAAAILASMAAEQSGPPIESPRQ